MNGTKRGRVCGLILSLGLCGGCEAVSNRLTKWQMLGIEALDDPLQAVGGDGIVFAPEPRGEKSARELATATPDQLVAYYAPVFVQQRVNTSAARYPYPQEYDEIGQARLRPAADGGLKAYVAAPPRVYAIYQKRRIGSRDHVQLTYTAWYPAHPRMKTFDLEEAEIDSCVVRATLDDRQAPMFYETIAACGCFHKVFVERWIEAAARSAFGAAEKGHQFVVERAVQDRIDWEVAGLVDTPAGRPARPVVFIKAGDHKVIGLNSSARMRVPRGADVRSYDLADYSELYSLAVDGTNERQPFFNPADGSKVWGAERKERFIFSWMGVDGAGQPRAANQIKLHFDQSTWDDPTIYDRFLRLPAGVL
jgi:hypothetical protein